MKATYIRPTYLNLHRFQDVAEYWSNFCCRQGLPLFNALVRGESLNSCLRNFAMLNRLGVIRECVTASDYEQTI